MVAMSGGVDSSVAAALLQEQGYEVIGITMRLWTVDNDSARRSCCSLDDVEDARRVADSLGIPHYTLNMKESFRENVVDYFVDEYERGNTPNPCIACNRVLKFEMLIEKAKQMGIKKLATGHYAQIEKRGERYLIKRGVDQNKDQSYFLFDTPPKNLRYILFPIGGLTKDETREKAKRFGLKTAEKQESQEICFVPEDDYKTFLTRYGVKHEKGDFVNSSGEPLGKHSGVPFYTVGQRRGLGIGHSHRLYVTEIKPESNVIVVGPEEELLTESMVATNTTLHLPIADGDTLLIKVRYRQEPVKGTLHHLAGGEIRVDFIEPIKAVAPGQAAVFYADDILVGGGWITSFASFRGEGGKYETAD